MKEEEKKAKKDGDGSGSPNVASLPEVITGAQINVNNEGITGRQMMFSNLRTFETGENETASLRSIFRSNALPSGDGELYATIKVGDDDSVQTVLLEEGSSVYQIVNQILSAKYGSNALDKVIDKLTPQAVAGSLPPISTLGE